MIDVPIEIIEEAKLELVSVWSESREGLSLSLRSLVVTVALSLLLLLLLKPMLGYTLEFLGLPCLFSPDTYYALFVGASFACIGLCLWREGIDLFTGLMVAAVAWIAVATFKNAGETVRLFTDWLPLLAVVCLVSALHRDYKRELLRAMFFACVFYLILNLVGIFRSGDVGFNSQVFLFFEVKTATFRIAIPAIICSLLLDHLNGKRLSISTVTVYGLCLFEVTVGFAATSLVTLLLFAFFVSIGQCERVREALNAVTFFGADLLAFLAVVVLRVQNHLGWFIEGVLGKTTTLSSRTLVWDVVFQLLSNGHFFWGYGASYIWNAIMVGSKSYMHAHNDILNIFMTGGLVLAVIALAMFLLVVRRLYRTRSLMPSFILSCGLGCFLLEGLFEITSCIGFFFVLAMAYYWFSGSRSRRA